MHDESLDGRQTARRALDYWQSVAGEVSEDLRARSGRENRSYAWMALRATARALAGVLGLLAGLAFVPAIYALLCLAG